MKKTSMAVSIAIALANISLANAMDLNPDPDQAYTMIELQDMAKIPVLIRTVLGGDYGQDPVDLKGFFLRVDSGFGNGQVLIMQTDSSDKRWEDVGVAAGMSGSPIYNPLNGKLLGALSYGYDAGYNGKILFAATPVALMNHSLMSDYSGYNGKGVKNQNNSLIANSSDQQCGNSDIPATGINRLLPITVSGMSPRLASKALKNLPNYHLSSASSSRAIEVSPLQAGSSIAVPVVTGDSGIGMSAIGTATTVFNGKIMAFGHPFFNVGNVNYPLYGAIIDGIDHSPFGQNKDGVLTGSRLGVITSDGRVGIAGEIGNSVKPAIIPVHTVVSKNGQQMIFDHQVSKIETHDFWNGNYTDWVGMTLMSILDQAFGTIGPQTVKTTISLTLGHYKKPIEFTSWSSDPDGSTPSVVGSEMYHFLNEAKTYGFDIKGVNFNATLYEVENSLYLDKMEVIGRIIAGAPMHLQATAHNAENVQVIKDIYLDIPSDAQGKSIEFDVGSASDLYENKDLSVRPTVKQWAEDVAKRGQSNALMAKMIIAEPIPVTGGVAPEPTVISKKVPSNGVVIGIQTVSGIVEATSAPTTGSNTGSTTH